MLDKWQAGIVLTGAELKCEEGALSTSGSRVVVLNVKKKKEVGVVGMQ